MLPATAPPTDLIADNGLSQLNIPLDIASPASANPSVADVVLSPNLMSGPAPVEPPLLPLLFGVMNSAIE